MESSEKNIYQVIRIPDATVSESEDGPDDVAQPATPPARQCVFAVKGTSMVVSRARSPAPAGSGPVSGSGPGPATVTAAASEGSGSGGCGVAASDIQRHLQDMLALIRPDDNLLMAVRLESEHVGRSRYLVVVASPAADECCLLGIDCQRRTTIGLVHRLLSETETSLDGDGAIVVRTAGDSHIFKPVSVQAMWSALQTLNRCRSLVPRPVARFDWVSSYERLVSSDQSCLNEWHAMEDIEYRRPYSPNCLPARPTEREEKERMIRGRLREIMLSVDLDQVTSKELRSRLEEQMGCSLKDFKGFIDAEMLVIMGQMDHASCIFEHLYLGSEWNASDLEELKRNGIGHIVNVTREIDNFFPGRFQYLNVRVYDEEATELLKHWDKTFKFIDKAKSEGSRVLVHCRMGVSRSAAVVVAYAMKAYGWSYDKALKYVREKRSCIKPNASFIRQLETYQGILDASRQRHNSLWRSKSETNLQCGRLLSPVLPPCDQIDDVCDVSTPCGPESPAEPPASRPKSWSPADNLADSLIAQMNGSAPGSYGRPQRSRSRSQTLPGDAPRVRRYSVSQHQRVPCNGQDYSVSQNQAVNLSLPLEPLEGALRPDPQPGDLMECVNPRLVPAETWVGNVVALRSAPRRPAEPAAGLVRRHTEDIERRSSSSDGARGSCGSVELALPSRQSSWSSLEGALLRANGLQSPSRSSSWGSYDAAHTVVADNDAAAAVAAAGPGAGLVGTPRSAGAGPVASSTPTVCLPPPTPDGSVSSLPSVSRMSVQLRQPSAVPRTGSFTVSLVNLAGASSPCRPAASSVSLTDELPSDGELQTTPGQVRRLARQLEARDPAPPPPPGSPPSPPAPVARSASLDRLSAPEPRLPSPSSPSPTDEVSVRSLVGRFEAPEAAEEREARRVSAPPAPSSEPPASPGSERQTPTVPPRKASLDLSRLASLTRRVGGQVFGRGRTASQPAPGPVVRTAQKPPPPPLTHAHRAGQPSRRRLHGKTHPLSKLDVRTRHVSSVFNTM
ncbi:protein phosphatase Slingshot-like isoform X1 [Amphibalanus amphitrite]|uniref:protein phosphatase Slingshot-like isoform X1 n=1 Tax=Amphibalanus amphitrite TaxID=1232801 RepID=UPI001C90D3FC|nr:protein phosphatase Slingshot-like isoform X1 [Amphibalanus amphitrite]